jgi:hypothetical protein
VGQFKSQPGSYRLCSKLTFVIHCATGLQWLCFPLSKVQHTVASAKSKSNLDNVFIWPNSFRCILRNFWTSGPGNGSLRCSCTSHCLSKAGWDLLRVRILLENLKCSPFSEAPHHSETLSEMFAIVWFVWIKNEIIFYTLRKRRRHSLAFIKRRLLLPQELFLCWDEFKGERNTVSLR